MRVTYTAGCKQEQGNAPYRELTLEHAADYHPYGSILREWRNGEAEKYLTTHHERDTETGLDYRGARYYDSDVARFLSLDPNASDYANWSAYNYVLGNPVSIVDPDGRDGWDIIKGIYAAWADNQLPSNPNPYVINIRERMSYSNGSHYNLGQDIGDVLSAIQGAFEIANGFSEMYAGGTLAGSGVAAVPITGGLSISASAAGVGLAVVGAAQVAHGGMVVLNAADNLSNGKGRVPETSREARRGAMREEGVPTSRSSTSQSGTKGNKQHVVEGADGKPRVVTEHPPDAKHPDPHWHAAKPKVDAHGDMRKNSQGQVKYQSGGSTVPYKQKKKD